MTSPNEIELQRRVMEARARLREGYTTRPKVDELCRLVAANQLREDMREQWRSRREWMTTSAG